MAAFIEWRVLAVTQLPATSFVLFAPLAAGALNCCRSCVMRKLLEASIVPTPKGVFTVRAPGRKMAA